MTRFFAVFVLLLLTVPAQAQSVPGTLSWTWASGAPADVLRYTLSVDGGPATDLSLPADGTVPLPLAPGNHTLVLTPVCATTLCGSKTTTVTVSTPGSTIQVTNLSPADGTSVKNNTALLVSATATDDSGIASAKLHWIYNGSDNSSFPVKQSGSDYSAQPLPTSGPGVRTWYWEFRAVDGEVLKTTPRTANVTP